MTNFNFVENGVIRLPPGFRFHPTDEELVGQYLIRKVLAYPLPASIIPQLFNISKFDPWDLPGDSEQEKYFFSTNEAKYSHGNRPNRASESGYWKSTGIDKKIVAFRSNQVMGMKKTLVFYRGKPSNGIRTDWIMHEYRLVRPATSNFNIIQRKNSTQNSLMHIGDWVLCKIFLKKRNGKNGREIDETSKKNRVNNENNNLGVKGRPRFIDFMMKERIDHQLSSSSSSSGSSGVTEVSSIIASDFEESSSSSCRRES